MGNLSPIVALFVNSMQKSQVFSVFLWILHYLSLTLYSKSDNSK